VRWAKRGNHDIQTSNISQVLISGEEVALVFLWSFLSFFFLGGDFKNNFYYIPSNLDEEV
jgi:hypothetical protein